MIGLLVALIVLAIVLWAVNQIPLPEPFSWVKILVFAVAAIWFVLYAARTLGVSVPLLN
jgi:Mg/Co/Ni transporter MgtE